jgi:hypothetical protein
MVHRDYASDTRLQRLVRGLALLAVVVAIAYAGWRQDGVWRWVLWALAAVVAYEGPTTFAIFAPDTEPDDEEEDEDETEADDEADLSGDDQPRG